jgi:hypothetical protein
VKSLRTISCDIALRGAQDQVRHLATRIQVELDRPGGLIESGLALRNQRKRRSLENRCKLARSLISRAGFQTRLIER